MVEKRYQVFIRRDCELCKDVLKHLKKSSVNTEVVDIGKQEGYVLAYKKKILKLPTILVLKPNNKDISRLYTVSELQEHLNALNIR